jgi:Skp family chaperone for outer membrane proteins
MRRVVIAVPLALLIGVPAFAQTPAQPPAQPAPKPTQPAPATPAAGQPAPQPAKPPAPLPFPQGAKIAFVNLQGIFSLSADGKAAAAKVESLTKQKQAQIQERQKVIQANQQKLQTGGTVMSDQARAALEKELEKQTRELERFQQDAQQELQDLQTELNDAFQRKLFPILTKMSEEKELHMLFSATDAGLIWAYGGLDLTEEAVKRLDTTK